MAEITVASDEAGTQYSSMSLFGGNYVEISPADGVDLTMNARAIYAGLLELSPERMWRVPISYQLALCYERLGATDNARLRRAGIAVPHARARTPGR